MKKERQVLLEVITGIWAICLVELLVGIFVAEYFGSYILGIFLGALTATLYYLHLFKSLDKSLDMKEEDAIKYSKKMIIIRYVMLGMIITLGFTFYRHINVIMLFIGIMGVKFSAYLQPVTHKCLEAVLGSRSKGD